MFQETLQGISSRCRNRVGVVIPWEFILAIISLIREHCPQWNSSEGFCRSCKQPGPFVRWWLFSKVRSLIDDWNANATGFGSTIPTRASGPIIDELFSTVQETGDEQLIVFYGQFNRAVRGEDPDEH